MLAGSSPVPGTIHLNEEEIPMKNKKILIAIIGGVVVVAGVVTAIILINVNKGSDSNNSNNNSNSSSQSTTNSNNNPSENPNSNNSGNSNSENNGGSNNGENGNSSNNSSSNSSDTQTQNPIVGTWRFDDPEFVNAGVELSYTFNADGTGNYNGAGQISNFTYATSGNNLHVDFGESGPMNTEYSISGDILYIKDITGNNTPYKKIR